MKKIYFLLILSCLCSLTRSAFAQISTFNYTGTVQTYVVPTGVTFVQIDARGAAGGLAPYECPSVLGGQGGRVVCNLSVTPGQSLFVRVGGVGGNGTGPGTTPAGGYNGGGAGDNYGGAGGGASDIRIAGTVYTATVLIVAGGGGGPASDYCPTDPGAAGGGAVAANGTYGGHANTTYTGQGGNTVTLTGGHGATDGGGTGSLGQGGAAESGSFFGGGGGGGYEGGGGGYYGSGGGGSSYPAVSGAVAGGATVSSIVHTPGFNTSSNGLVIFTPPNVIASPSSMGFGVVTTGTTSTPIPFTLTGSVLNGSALIITPPANFQISPDGGVTWYTSSTPYILSYTSPGFTNIPFLAEFLPTSSISYSGNILITGGGLPTVANIAVTGSGSAICTGTPTTGTASATPTSGSGTTSFTLAVSGTTVAGGLTYQWQQAPSNIAGEFTNIYGATNPTFTFTGLTATTYFQCIVTCPTFTTAISNVVQITLTGTGAVLPTATAIAAPSPLAFGNVTTGTSSIPPQYFVLSGTGLSSLPFTIAPPPNYALSTDGVTWSTSPITVNYTPGYPTGSLSPTNIYVQFNAPATPGAYPGTITINGGNVPVLVNVALTGTSISTVCSGTPTTGTAAVSPASGGLATTFTLSLPGVSAAGGLVYQWQSSINSGTTWTNVPEGLSAAFTYTGLSATTQYRCLVGCGLGAPVTSGSVTATYVPIANSSCTPNSEDAPCSEGAYLGSATVPFTMTGANGTSITDAGACGAGNGGSSYYYNNSSSSIIFNPGGSYTGIISGNAEGYPTAQAWIDYNNDGAFQTSEIVGGFLYSGGGAPAHPPLTITVPASAALGVHRMRIAYALNDGFTYPTTDPGFPAYPAVPSCPTNSNTYYIETRDYTAVIAPPGTILSQPCAGTPTPGIVSTSSPTVGCVPLSVDIFNVGETYSPGMVYQWQSSTSPTGGFTNVAGATNSVYVPTVATAGTLYFRDSVTCTNSATGAVSTKSLAITGNPLPTTITGTLSACPGTTTTLNSTPAGGWSSSNTGVATINSSGVVFGVVQGSTTITYTLPVTSCTTTALVTVNPLPLTPTGSVPVCPRSTITLVDANTGGTWASGNTAIATVITGSGVVTGVSGGTAAITYTLPTTCAISIPVSVNPASPITGSPGTCQGTTTTLADAVTGGTWASSINSVATIGSSTGVVSGILLGTTLITYTIPVTGCTVTQVVNITNAPTTFTMTGGGSYCSGGPGVHVGLNGSTIGVAYQVSNTTSGPSGSFITGTGSAIDLGLVTAAGTYTIVANPGTACAANMTGSATVTELPLPVAYPVSGGGSYCPGGTGVSVSVNNSDIGYNYQLFVGGVPASGQVAGTGISINFGAQTTAGLYTVVATNPANGCTNNMTGNATVILNAAPVAFDITGGGAYCLGGSGVHVGLSGSVVGRNYQLTIAGVPVGSPLPGTGSALDYGFQTAAGVYNVIATVTATGCTGTMSGSATVIVNSLPTAYGVTGGGTFCAGTGSASVGLNGSTIGINYQLYATGTGGATNPSGSITPGTGVALNFGSFITPGSYTVAAINATTGCASNMFGSAAVATNPLPSSFSITGGGPFCVGAAGVHIGLNGSVPGDTYYLYNGSTITGAAAGTSLPIDFGAFTAVGTYTVVATTAATGCTGSMSGSTTVTMNPVPASFNVTGGGSYCPGSTGPSVGLSGSAAGVSYLLYNGTTLVSTLPGSSVGAALNFGPELTGAYSVVAINTSTTCISNMTGSASVLANPLPTVFAVTGGGGYCAGTTGVHVGLSSSNTGINYTLFKGSVATTPVISGIGGAIDFGLETATTAGTAATYTILAVNVATSCSVNMSGSAVVSISPLPNNSYSITGGGSYCFGGTGVHLGTNNSETGVNYQLLNGGVPAGAPVAGSVGTALDFGLQTAAGTYTVAAANATTSCASNLSGTATIAVNPLPAVSSVTGGGAYCAGTAGVHVGLNTTTSGIKYQLWNGAVATLSPVTGTGSSLDFGLVTAGNYTVVATNPSTGCNNNMSGSAVITLNPAPVSSYSVTGGGSYCTGGSGLAIGLSSSTGGVSYQLMSLGLPVGSPVAGTGLALNFGVQASGAYTVIGTAPSTGCSATMTGNGIVSISPVPTLFTVTGGGNYCPGTAGKLVGLSGSSTGTSYQLYNGSTPAGAAVTGTGSPINFGNQTTTGNYMVVATNITTTCTGDMSGSVNIGLSALPVVYNVTGGGSYCPAGSGVHIGLNGSNLGMSYQLSNGSGPVGAAIPGSGFSLDFGSITPTGTYTVVSTNTTTGCSSNMSGTANVAISSAPTPYNVTGGGNICSGASAHIGLSGSDAGTLYQLKLGILSVGSPVPGTGSLLDLGAQSAAGTYTVIASSPSTTCDNTMSGNATIAILPQPSVFTVSTGGSYCAGTGGIDVTLSSSETGVKYQLYNGGVATGAPITGTGSLIDFGSQAAAGTYTVVGSNIAAGCMTTMFGSSAITVNTPPVAYTVTGGGSYCAGGTGVHVTLSGSNTGINYQLIVSGSGTGTPVPGTGSSLDFGSQTQGGAYTVVATNTTTNCTNTMASSANITANALPTVYTLTSSGSYYCAGGAGIDVALSGSDAGINYQLYNGSVTTGAPVAGTGTTLHFGLQTGGGSYTAIAINPGTSCNSAMAGSAAIVVNPLPTAYTVTGGGGYCDGGAGVHVGLSGSNTGISYQVYNTGASTGSPVMGTGFALDLGLETASGSYTVIATNAGTECTNTMSGNTTVTATPLPTVYSVIGGGNYCAGSPGVHIGLSGSTSGVNYQLYTSGGALVGPAVPGTGLAIDFGLQTAAATYTVKAINATTSCTSAMAGSAVVGINSLPTAYAVTGGGNYCPGGTGVLVGLGGSGSTIKYQLYNGVTPTGSSVTGTGAAISFGLQTAGVYTVVAINPANTCTGNMSGSVTVALNPAPVAYTVIGGGNYCTGGTGVHVGVNGSTTGVNYQLWNGSASVGFPVPGTGGPLDFGLQTAGVYTVIASNATTTCSSTMSGTAAVIANAPVTPTVSLSTGVGDTLCAGTLVTINTLVSNGGTSPMFAWSVNGSPVSGTGSAYIYTPVDGDVVSASVTSNATCATPPTVGGSLTLSVLPNGNPTISISATPAEIVCQGATVTFNNANTFAGTEPTFTWILNGANAATTPSYSYVPNNGDMIYCIMTSDYRCRLENAVTSNHITMEVGDTAIPVVTITAHPGTSIAKGQSLTLSATVVNGGTAPSYQWFINSIAVPGANQPSYTSSNFANGDSVTCLVVNSSGCAGLGSFNSVEISVSDVGVTQITSAGSDIKLLPNPNKGVFTIKGTLGTTDDEEVTLEITDMLGQVIYKDKVMAHGGSINEKIQLSNTLANGMYELSLHAASANEVFHVIIEQ